MFLVLWMQFFAQAGFPCPALRNPSDHFLRCVNSDFDKVRATLKGSMKLRVLKHLLPFELLSNLTCWSSCYSTSQFEASDDPLEKITTTEAIRVLVDYYHTSDYYYTTKAKVEEISQYVSTLCFFSRNFCWSLLTVSTLQKGTILDSGGSQASFLLQTYTLTKRSFINMSRDFGYYWLRLLIYILVTFCIGTIYWKVGTSYSAILVNNILKSYIGNNLNLRWCLNLNL